jgi:glycosyltransferase involved in cell wall biosynthesis
MIYFDTTKAAQSGHRSGLMRVSAQLAATLGDAATAVRWPAWTQEARKEDWFLTSELFSEEERPGLGEFLAARSCRAAAIFHDAIPLKHPQITWPQSVARHPGYMKLLARFDRVWAVSAASRAELMEFWKWQGVESPPPVEVLALGADFNSGARVTHRAAPATDMPSLLCVGILEPRKNQTLLLDVAEELWAAGRRFELHLVGRVNPHFGQPILARIRALAKRFSGLHFLEAASDADVAQLYGQARVTLFPTLAEGCGLPLLESLWMGVPCICSDLPVLRENADGGGCVPVAVNDRAAWLEVLRRVLTDEALLERLTKEAMTRALPTWSAAGETIRRTLLG